MFSARLEQDAKEENPEQKLEADKIAMLTERLEVLTKDAADLKEA